MQVQYNIQDWIRYILYTGAAQHENQLLQNKTTGRPLCQGGSSWRTAPAAAVPVQRTGAQPFTLQLHSLRSNPSLKPHPRA